MGLLQPQEKEIETGDGEKRTYIISKFPATDGREIVTQYPLSGLPKIGEYKTNETLMLKLMSFVGVPREGADALVLSTKQLVNNHVPDFETLMRIEMAMMEYNCSFFRNGRLSTSLNDFVGKALKQIMSTLTGSLQSSPPKDSQPSTNSEPSTP